MEEQKIIQKKRPKIWIAGVAAVVILMVAGLMISVFVSDGSDREYNDHLDLARKYLDEMNYEQAVVELRLAIEIEPNNSEAYFELAEVYTAMGDYESAQAVLAEGYAATGDERLAAEQERLAAEQERLAAEQERPAQEYDISPGQDGQESNEAGQTVGTGDFYEKYAELCSLGEKAFIGRARGTFDRYLTFQEREEAYGGLAELLEQYLVDLDRTEGLPEELFSEEWDSTNGYYTKRAAYDYLADAYLYMGKLEECLRVRTEWADYCGRPDLVQDGNHGYSIYDGCERYEYDKYGRLTGAGIAGEGERSEYIYGEPHDGATHWTSVSSGEVFEEEYIYDSEGRIQHRHRVITRENEGTTTLDYDYAYTGNHSFITTYTSVQPDGETDGPEEYDEQFYDEYGTELYYREQ